MSTLSPEEEQLEQVERAIIAKQTAPLRAALLSPEMQRDAGKLAMFDELVRELEIAFNIFDTLNADSTCTAMRPTLDRAIELQKAQK
jgi:hypothetical protein